MGRRARDQRRMYLEKLYEVRLALVGALQPDKCPVVVAQPKVSNDQGAGVPRPLAFFQFIQVAKCIAASPGLRIRHDQPTGDAWAPVRNRNWLLQLWSGKSLTITGCPETRVGALK